MKAFRTYPHSAFLNTDIHLISKETTSVFHIFNEEVVNAFSVEAEKEEIIHGLNIAGVHTFIDVKGNKEDILVEDAIRLGSSTIKESYVFENPDIVILVLHDRMKIYDIKLNRVVFEENNLTPDNIELLSNGKLLFSSTRKCGNDNYSTIFSQFSLDTFEVENSFRISEVVARVDTYIAIKEHDYCAIYNLLSMRNIWERHITCNMSIWEDSGHLFIVGSSKQEVISVKIDKTHKERVLNIPGKLLSITKEGIVVSILDREFIYCDVRSCSSKSDDTFRHIGRIPDDANQISFEGHIVEDWGKPYDPGLKNMANENNLTFEGTFTVEQFKANQHVDVLKIFMNPKTGKLFFTYGAKTGAVSAKGIPQKPVVSLVTNKAGNSFYLLHEESAVNDYIKAHSHIKYEYSILATDYNESKMAVKKVVIKNSRERQDNGDYKDRRERTETMEIFHSNECITEHPYNSIFERINACSSKFKCSKSKYVIQQDETHINIHNLTKGTSMSIPFKEELFTDGLLSPDGSYLTFEKDGKYAYYNIKRGKIEYYFDTRVIGYSNCGELLLGTGDYRRLARIMNPHTFQYVNSNEYQYYMFVSPDGTLKAGTNPKIKYYHRIKEMYIDSTEYGELKSKLGSRDSNVIETISDTKRLQYRKEMYDSHKDFFDKLKRESAIKKKYSYGASEKKIDENKVKEDIINDICIEDVVETQKYIILSSDSSTYDMRIEDIDFVNYIAFSYDNHYVAVVGKPRMNQSGGYVQINGITVSSEGEFTESKCIFQSSGFSREMPKKAAWTCGFSKQGTLFLYDSVPNTYYIKAKDMPHLTNNAKQDDLYVHKLEEYSWLCASKSGRYLALSEQGYDAMSAGGQGHVPSSAIHIIPLQNDGRRIDFNCGGNINRYSYDDRYKKNANMVAFSDDDSRFMIVRNDGVILIKNIN